MKIWVFICPDWYSLTWDIAGVVLLWYWPHRFPVQHWCVRRSEIPDKCCCLRYLWFPQSMHPAVYSTEGPSECLQSHLTGKQNTMHEMRITAFFCISLFGIINIHHLTNCWFQLLLNAYFILFTTCTNHVRTIPDWLIKKQTSSLKTGVCLSRKSLASSTITGSSVSSSISCRVCSKKELQYMYSKMQTYLIHRFQCRHILT